MSCSDPGACDLPTEIRVVDSLFLVMEYSLNLAKGKIFISLDCLILKRSQAEERPEDGIGRFRRERDRTSCDDNPTDIVSSPVGYPQAAIVHYFSDHNSPRDDMSCSNEAIIAKSIPSNKPEEIRKAVCPQSRKAPVFVGN
jgi:hypothetical protein